MSTSPFFVPFKNGFNAILWCCLHITSKRTDAAYENGDIDGTCKQALKSAEIEGDTYFSNTI